ncbi:MAG TPA: hypothetical protein VLV82_00915 [Candidatus Angelobacter sp.]|nr:hypothetical protein [Candidatus Angelobacter sp.]
MGNRLWGGDGRPAVPRWARVLGVVIAVAVALFAFYLAIRWSADLGRSEAHRG